MPVGATPPLAVHALGADLNVYAYVGGRVASHTDAWGLCSQEAPGACIGGAYHPDAAGNQSGWSVGDGNSTYSPSGEHHGLVGEMFREWVANGRPSYAGLDWGAVTPELSLSGPAWDLAPAPGLIFDLGSIGAQAASAGGVPTFGSAIQESPSSRADWLAKQHPALRNSIRGAQRQETFIQAAPLIVAVLTYGASAAPEVAAEGAAAGGGGAATMDTAAIRFTQSSVKGTFADGRTVQGTVDALAGPGGDAVAAQIPPIRIFEGGGALRTLDNRRLLTFSEAGRPVPYVWATPAEVAAESWKFTATPQQMGGWFIRVK